MSEHTPGPWEVGTEGNGSPGFVYCDNSLGSAVAVVYGPAMRHSVFSRAEEEANARLIAAAPDLLEALNLLHSAAWRASRGNPEDITAELLEKTGAAIDKAIGRG